MDDALRFASVLELAALLRAGEVSSAELVTASIQRIEATQPTINAFTVVDGERALAQARGIAKDDPRPLAGVPIAIKDLTPVRGWPISAGSSLLDGVIGDHDGNAVARLRAAGMVIVGLTSTPEFGLLAVTEPRRFGPTRNPWDTARTPGGSSGGSAAAVAAGLVGAAHGSDGGGSIRVPAACCGLVGLKPSRGRISRGPDAGDGYLPTDGVLTRDTLSTAQLLDVLTGYEVGDATWAPPPESPFLSAAIVPPRALRIAVTVDPPLGQRPDPVDVAAVREVAALLGELGHEVVDAAPPWSAEALVEPFMVLWSAMTALGVRWASGLAGREPGEDDIEPLTRVLAQRGEGITAVEYLAALAALQAQARAVVAFFAGHDVLLTPMLGRRPPPVGEIDACGEDPMAAIEAGWAFNPFGATWNATGQPAISLPVVHGPDAMPAGVQLVGRPLAEGTLLSLAAQLEQARPWASRNPPVAGR